ncbi:MAG: AmmeMemoRadiSam system protein B [bacterium]|nr:AmmeMemoRadiSam system protein B [bacterium]
MIRMPAVAGTFYDGDAGRLRALVKSYLPKAGPAEAIGVMVPHAGYMYSGEVAGAVYARIRVPDSYLVLSPNHTGLGPPVSIMSSGGWETPLGTMAIDEALAAAVKEGSALIEEDRAAHQREHSIEVQLPFLQFLSDAPFVPITLMGIDYGSCEKVAAALAEAIRASSKRVLLVASSDMTHFESSTAAAAKDRLALDRMEALDPEGLYHVVVQHKISMCGFIPATIMLIAAKLLGATTGTVIDYRNSGDVSGDYDQVVGYAGVIVG